MNLKRFYHGFCLAGLTGLFILPTGIGAAHAERFSFSLKGLGVSEQAEGDRTLSGSMILEGDAIPEAKVIDFGLTHGDRGDDQSVEVNLLNQGESILEAVFDVFGLNRRASIDKLDAKVSGEMNEQDSELGVDLGENLPGMRLKIKTPQ